MRHLTFALAGISCLVCGCAAAGSGIRFVAADMPNSIAPAYRVKGIVEVSRTRFGFHRPPQDIEGMVRDLQQKIGTPVLRNADVNLVTPVCLTPLPCLGTDTATADAAE